MNREASILISGLLLALIAQGAGLAQESQSAVIDSAAVEAAEVAVLSQSLEVVEASIATEPEAENDVEPVRPPPAPVVFRYPFSISDCETLLDRAVEALPDPEEAPREVHKESIERLIRSVTEYIKMRDDLHSSLIDYRWEQVGRARVDATSEPMLDLIEFPGAVAPGQVSALSFETLRADTWLTYLRVYDDEGRLTADYATLREEPVLLCHSLPRREVFHLWKPTTISKVEFEYVSAGTGGEGDVTRPRIVINAGRTDQAEHGKAAIYYLTRAQQMLEADRPADARFDLLNARRELVLYSQSLRQRL